MKTFTEEEAREIGDTLGIDFSAVSFSEFCLGLAVELEHGARDTQTNVTNDDPLLTGKVAWAHLKEIKDYYTRLREMEKESEA